MKAQLTWSGVIERKYCAWGSFETIQLEQEDGYKIDLVARLNEAVMNHGQRVSVRYWVASVRQSKEEMMKGAILRICGAIGIEHEAHEYSYSEYTHGVDYFTILNIDKHNLYEEILSHAGRFLWLEVDFLNN